MTEQVLNTYRGMSNLDELQKAFTEALADAGDDRIAEGQDVRVHASEVYFAPINVDLIRERLTDGSYVYNLRIRTAVDHSQLRATIA